MSHINGDDEDDGEEIETDEWEEDDDESLDLDTGSQN